MLHRAVYMLSGYNNILPFLGLFSISVPFNLLSPCPNYSWIRVTRQESDNIKKFSNLNWILTYNIYTCTEHALQSIPISSFSYHLCILQFYSLVTQSFPLVCLHNVGHLMVHVYWQTVMTMCWEYLTCLWSCIMVQLCMDCQKWYVYSLIHTKGSLCHHGMLMYSIM